MHITTGLDNGGAENLLTRLVSRMDRARFENVVLSLTDEGPELGNRIRQRGIRLDCLGFRRGKANPLLIWKTAQHIKAARPDVVQTWLYHADLVGALAQRLARRRVPMVWGLHNMVLSSATGKTQTIDVTRLNARLSHSCPDSIICCSDAVRECHAEIGYAPSKMQVIANGIDIDEFVPNASAASALRKELALAEKTPLIGLIARFDPQKDHATFFRAAGLLHQARPDVHFVLCGREITLDNPAIACWIAQSGMAGVTHLLGLRGDIARVTAGLDAATCCSVKEAFALVLGEAMACGVPCVTTDLAGPVSVLGEHGYIVPVGEAAHLAHAWANILDLSPEQRLALGRKARLRVAERFSLASMVSNYEALYAGFSCSQGEIQPEKLGEAA